VTVSRKSCPICRGGVAERGANPAFPFCSERCRLIDLGRWLGEEYRVPDAPVANGADSSSEPK
jgi:endogenous inhibitor of DNA gyrase (YacG/DUF329 family)